MTVAQIFGMDQSVISEANLELGMGGMLEGVCLGYLEECRPSGGVFSLVHTGMVAVGGVFVHVTVDEVLVIRSGDALPRYDRFVVRRDNTTNAVSIYVKEGTPAAVPSPPPLTRSGGIYEVSLARLYMPAGALPSLGTLTDERGEHSLCGYISFKAYNQVQRAAEEGWRQRGSWSARADAAAMAGTLLYQDVSVQHSASAVDVSADGVALRQDTSGALNNEVKVWSGQYVHCITFPLYGWIYGSAFECKFKLGQTTQERFFVGFNDVPPIGADAPVNRYIGVQYSTARVDANFQFISCNGGAQSRWDSGVPVDTNAHVFRATSISGSAVILELLDTSRNVQAALRVSSPIPEGLLWVHSALRALAASVKSLYQYNANGVNRNI